MVDQDTFDVPLEPCEVNEAHSQSCESSQQESAGRWESYSLSILSVFFDNC